MSWKPEVEVSGKWYSNSLRFATEQEARDSARDLMGRWLLVTDHRAATSDEPVKHRYDNGKLESL